jgi:hypothetical protein
MLKYINKPIISLVVVINGPVAKAGSILYLCKIKGIHVPKTAAKIITQNKDKLTVKLIKI